MPGAELTDVKAINDFGQMVGMFVRGSIQFQGFVTELQDTTPPVITLSVTPNILWPPNHQLVEITVTVTATDDHDPNPLIELVSITSNQPSNGHGDGSPEADIVVQNGHIYLRAERSGNMMDRIYTITCGATDAAGNSATASATVRVPHN